MSVIRQLQNNKKDMQQTRIQTQPMPELKAGEALLRISRLALTTNNVTYAAFGETPHLRYWDFYPTGDSEWFHMPAWGFAEVLESTVDGLAKGERFYGFWPIASHVVMQPVRVSERGFFTTAPNIDSNSPRRTTSTSASAATPPIAQRAKTIRCCCGRCSSPRSCWPISSTTTPSSARAKS